MKNNSYISIIVPAYNAERYIKKCLESLVNQTFYNNLELIVVDDGSTDDTKNILDDYEVKYKNVKVYHTDNNGVSNARNYGLEQACGKYITFVDADDWVDLDCYEKMYKIAEENDIDIVAAGLYVDGSNGHIVTRELTDQDILIDKITSIREYLYGNFDVHIYNKLFRRDIIIKHKFDIKLRIAEDRLFLFECLLDADKVFCMKRCFYHYFQNESSVMNQKFTEKNLDNIIVGEKIVEEVSKKYPELINYAKSMYVSMECRLYGEIYAADLLDKYLKEYTILKKDIKSCKIMKFLKYTSKKHIIALILAKISPALYNYFRNNPIVKFKR